MNIFDLDNQKQIEQAERDAEERIQRATALAFMKNTEGWAILLDTFEQMKENQLVELGRHRPGDDLAVLAAHSVWYSVQFTLNQIVTAVDAAIQDGEAAKLELVQLRQTPVENEDNWS